MESKAQFRQFISAPYEWQNEFEVPVLDSSFIKEDAIALLEFNRMAVRGQKSQFMNIYFEQKGIIQFQNQEGINTHNAFLLPRALDPFYEGQFMPINEKDYQPFFNVRMLFFAGRIKKPNGKIEPAIFRYAFPDKRRIIDKQFERVFLYFVQVTNLEPGDILEYHYKYEVPYDVNWMHFNSSRIFHESDIVKQNYQLQVEIPKKLRSTFKGELPEETWEEGNTAYRLWKKKSIPALLKEKGSRIYNDVPHVVFKLNENNLSYAYRHPRSGELLPTRFYNYIARTRQNKDFWYRRVARRKMVFDKQSRMFRTWIEKGTNEAQSPLEKLTSLNADIARNFNFHDDLPYYSLQDFGLEKMGDFTLAKRIRDISRHNIYTKIFNRLGFRKYKVLYVLDKRIGRISEDYPSNLYFNERIFFSNDTNAAYVFPKRSRMGYEVNELPFYFENTRAFGYTLDGLFENGERYFQTDTITVSSQQNERKTALEIKVDIEKEDVQVKAIIDLHGQFSTLTRGAYLYNEIDSTINPNYGLRIFDRAQNVTGLKSKAELNLEDNLLCKIETDFQSSNTVYKDGDNLDISLSGLLNFIIWDELDFEKRRSTFYPDFAFEDHFEIKIELDEDIQLREEIMHVAKNEYGEFFLDLRQENETGLSLKAKWILNEIPIPADDISKLKEFYDLIELAKEINVKLLLKN